MLTVRSHLPLSFLVSPSPRSLLARLFRPVIELAFAVPSVFCAPIILGASVRSWAPSQGFSPSVWRGSSSSLEGSGARPVSSEVGLLKKPFVAVTLIKDLT